MTLQCSPLLLCQGAVVQYIQYCIRLTVFVAIRFAHDLQLGKEVKVPDNLSSALLVNILPNS